MPTSTDCAEAVPKANAAMMLMKDRANVRAQIGANLMDLVIIGMKPPGNSTGLLEVVQTIHMTGFVQLYIQRMRSIRRNSLRVIVVVFTEKRRQDVIVLSTESIKVWARRT